MDFCQADDNEFDSYISRMEKIFTLANIPIINEGKPSGFEDIPPSRIYMGTCPIGDPAVSDSDAALDIREAIKHNYCQIRSALIDEKNIELSMYKPFAIRGRSEGILRRIYSAHWIASSVEQIDSE